MKRHLVIFGTLFSLVLLIVIFARLEWDNFFNSLSTLETLPLLGAALLVSAGVALRSLRWNFTAAVPLKELPHFWQAANIGYLGNLIYPARAGEVLRIAALHHFVPVGLGRVITSALLDRIMDVAALGLFMFGLIWLYGQDVFGAEVKIILAILFTGAVIFFILLVLYGKTWHQQLHDWHLPTHSKIRYRLRLWLLHMLETVLAFSSVRIFSLILVLSISAFVLDCAIMSLCFYAFGWDLPFSAAVTVAVFVVIGIAVPSAPGYVGVYQVACLFALKLYGIEESSAIAFSLVVQLVNWLVIGLQGGLVAARCGFNLSRPELVGRDI